MGETVVALEGAGVSAILSVGAGVSVVPSVGSGVGAWDRRDGCLFFFVGLAVGSFVDTKTIVGSGVASSVEETVGSLVDTNTIVGSGVVSSVEEGVG